MDKFINLRSDEIANHVEIKRLINNSRMNLKTKKHDEIKSIIKYELISGRVLLNDTFSNIYKNPRNKAFIDKLKMHKIKFKFYFEPVIRTRYNPLFFCSDIMFDYDKDKYIEAIECISSMIEGEPQPMELKKYFVNVENEYKMYLEKLLKRKERNTSMMLYQEFSKDEEIDLLCEKITERIITE